MFKKKKTADLDLPNRRPSSADRLGIIADGMEWDASAHTGRMRLSYRGSDQETDDRDARNVPTARNGSNERQ